MTEQLTTRDGRTLAYRRIGSGPTLVCHPGGPGFSSLYLGDLAGLGQELELVLLDPRGTGGSDPAARPRAYAIADYVADVEELREHLGLERLLLLGHSHGGVVAIEYAATHPDRVERLILASTLAALTARAGGRDAAGGRGAGRASPGTRMRVDALETEAAGSFDDGRRADGALPCAMMPLYFADYGEREQRVRRLAATATRSAWTRCGSGTTEIFERFDMRPLLPEPDDADARDHRRARTSSPGRPVPRSSPRASRRPRRSCCRDSATSIFVEAPEQFREAVLSFLGVGARA